MKVIIKKMFSIFCIAIIAINLFACGTSGTFSANNISATKFQSELARDYKKIFDKDFIQEKLDGHTVAEVVGELVNDIKTSEKEDAKEFVKKYGAFLKSEYFANDLSTYNWLATFTVQSIKNSLNDGTFPMEVVDQANSVLPLFGLNTIVLDSNKKDYTDKDAEEIAIKFFPLLDKIADQDILRELGIDLDDPETLSKVFKILTSSNNESNTETEKTE